MVTIFNLIIGTIDSTQVCIPTSVVIKVRTARQMCWVQIPTHAWMFVVGWIPFKTMPVKPFSERYAYSARNQQFNHKFPLYFSALLEEIRKICSTNLAKFSFAFIASTSGIRVAKYTKICFISFFIFDEMLVDAHCGDTKSFWFMFLS